MATKKTSTKKQTPIEEVMPAPIVEAVEEPVKISKYLVVTADSLNVRKGPSTEKDVVTIVSKNDKLLINKEELVNGFYEIMTASGIKGYVMSDFVVEE